MSKKAGTLVTHATAKRGTLSQKAKFTLGQGNLRAAVTLPENEEFATSSLTTALNVSDVRELTPRVKLERMARVPHRRFLQRGVASVRTVRG